MCLVGDDAVSCFGSVEKEPAGRRAGGQVGRFVVAVGSGSGRNAVIKVWRAESRREICQSNWSKRLETCCMVHHTDALIAQMVGCW